MTQIRIAAVVAMVGASLVVVGCFSPWVEGHGLSRSGVDGDGYFLLYAVVLAGSFATASLTTPAVARISRWLVLPFALLTLGMAIDHLRGAWGAELHPVQGPRLPLDVRYGIWLVVAGAVVLLGASVAMLVTRVHRPVHEDPPPTSDGATITKVAS